MTIGGWRWQPDRFRAELERLGYDVDAAEARLAAARGSVTARRDRGARSDLIALDAGGRFRATVTFATGETSAEEIVAGVPVRVVAEGRRILTVAATLTDAEQVAPVVAALDRLTGGMPDRRSTPGRRDVAPAEE
jgi:hypothetical protein